MWLNVTLMNSGGFELAFDDNVGRCESLVDVAFFELNVA